MILIIIDICIGVYLYSLTKCVYLYIYLFIFKCDISPAMPGPLCLFLCNSSIFGFFHHKDKKPGNWNEGTAAFPGTTAGNFDQYKVSIVCVVCLAIAMVTGGIFMALRISSDVMPCLVEHWNMDLCAFTLQTPNHH